jgi:hypothetical protein
MKTIMNGTEVHARIVKCTICHQVHSVTGPCTKCTCSELPYHKCPVCDK